MPRVPTTWRVRVLREARDTPPRSLAGAAFGSECHQTIAAEQGVQSGNVERRMGDLVDAGMKVTEVERRMR